MDTVLRVEGLTKRFGGIVVADALDLGVAPNTCLGVIGPNGAGKTSVFNLIDGSIRRDAGRIFLSERDISDFPKHQRARLGIARTYQIPQPFPDLTVFENVLTAATFSAGLSAVDAGRAAKEMIERTGLSKRMTTMAGALTLLDRKRLELARALAAAPKVLLLDEVAGGLTEQEVRVLVELIRSLKKDVAMIWSEHVAHALVAVADSIFLLNFGRKIAEGDPQALLDSREVREIYMGIVVDAAVGS
jgi:branched-chain amino acid transport system ATP-binding protein